MQAEIVRDSGAATVHLLTGVGTAVGAYIPFVYGMWLILIPSCGTTKFGGMLLITVGSVIGASAARFVGWVLGSLCVLIPVESETYRYSLTKLLAFFIAVATIVISISLIERDVRNATTRAYLMTLVDRVNQYQKENRTVPSSMSELQLELIANPFEIEASELTIERKNGGYRIFHIPTGIEVNGTMINSASEEGK